MDGGLPNHVEERIRYLKQLKVERSKDKGHKSIRHQVKKYLNVFMHLECIFRTTRSTGVS